jgi:hypothetical protein
MEKPFAVSYGLGVDSTAMLVGLAARGIRPDLILFADTGGEKPETYAYLPVINAWLAEVGFPTVTVVKYEPVRAPYRTLEGKCEANETLPSLAFGGKSCSIVFKAEVMNKHCKAHWEAAKAAWARGEKPIKAIGYDSGPADSKRCKTTEDAHYRYWYPLREWGWDRERCKAEIMAAGLPVPMKSACFFCPASKKPELDWLATKHPELFARAVAMEERARTGKHGLTGTKGLGRSFSWREYGEGKGFIKPAGLAMYPSEPAAGVECEGC